MDCPVCHTPMRKIEWRITSNHGEGEAYKEYDRTKYHCEVDDVWVDTEIPVAK